MSEKQRLLNILSRFGDYISVESVIYTFLRESDKDYPDLRLNRFIIGLTEILYDRQLQCERVARVSLERATYLKNYLDGNLYKDEETARVRADNKAEIFDRNFKKLTSGEFGNPEKFETMVAYWKAQAEAGYPLAEENVRYFDDMARKENENGKS